MLEIKITIACPDLVLAATAIAKAAGLRSTQNESQKPTADNGNTSAHIAQPTPQPTPTPAVPVNPTPAQVSAGPVVTSPAQTSAPSNPNPAPQVSVVPVAAAPTYTLDQISRAGASLVDAGKMEPLLALLARYGVAAVTQLAPEQYGAFATELRALGAQI